MLSASEARNTGFAITAHVRTLCCDLGDFAEKTRISIVFLKRFFWVEDKETLNLSRNRKKRYRRLFLNGRNCLIVGATQNH